MNGIGQNFDEVNELAVKKSTDLFDTTIYLKSPDNKYRYALGTKGEKTLFCFGINPSTATPEKHDQTISKVKNITYKKGFDSFVMLNIYPLRATDPKLLPEKVDWQEHNINVDAILHLLKDGAVVWAAWGDLINSRKWLKECRNDILSKIMKTNKNIRWVKMGALTKNGNPRHPLYLKYQDFSNYEIGENK